MTGFMQLMHRTWAKRTIVFCNTDLSHVTCCACDLSWLLPWMVTDCAGLYMLLQHCPKLLGAIRFKNKSLHQTTHRRQEEIFVRIGFGGQIMPYNSKREPPPNPPKPYTTRPLYLLSSPFSPPPPPQLLQSEKLGHSQASSL